MSGPDRNATLVAAFAAAHGRLPTGLIRAPGRVNLIGEHTDYNDGFCLPMAIDRDQRMAWAPRRDDLVRVVDVGLPGEPPAEFRLAAAIPPNPARRWVDYLQGCAQVLVGAGVPLVGCDLALHGTVPLGSGLSSSAALEVATILALCAAAGRTLDPATVATLGQRAENTYVGNRCGILDQLASACCRAGHAMLMDCRSLELAQVPLDPAVNVVIADTGRRRGLVDSAYNERRAQCEAGAAALGVSHLRDVTLPGLWRAAATGRLPAAALPRCEHVVNENGRTLAAAACLRAGDLRAFGQLMDQSHADLRDRFAVTCPELDEMVAIGRSLPGCLGSRMTGAGFGGCTVHLVRCDAVTAFVPALTSAYGKAFPDRTPAVHVTGAAAGAGPLPLPH
jgi:galactokinase